MARIIKKISFKNFYNYYGDYQDNTFEFENGLNVVVADNGAGKSKLFNGFLWIIENAVFDSDNKSYSSIENAKFLLIADKAKIETPVNDEIIAGVKLVYFHEELERTYEIIKEVSSKRISDDSATNEENWETKILKPIFNQKSAMGDMPIYRKEEQEDIIKALLKPGLKRYSLLQGEEVDQIVDLSDPANLSNTIKDLSDINDVEKITEMIQFLNNKAEKDYHNALRKSKSYNTELDGLIKKKSEIENKLVRASEKLEQAKNLHAKEEALKDKKLSLAENAKKRDKFRKKIESLERDLTSTKLAENELVNSINGKLFSRQSNWLLYRTNIEEDLTKLRSEYQKRKQKILVDNEAERKLQTMLPQDSPDNTSLQNMLNQEKCFVCNRDAKKETMPWKHIKAVLDSHTSDPESEDDIFRNDFSHFLDDLFTTHATIRQSIPKIRETIISENKKMCQFQKKKIEIDEKLKEVIEEFHSYGGKNDDESGQSDRNLINDTIDIMNNIHAFKRNIDFFSKEIKELEIEKSRLDSEIKKRNKNTIEKGYEQNKDILTHLNSAIKNARQTIFNEKIALLEKEANKQFRMLTKHNEVSGGILKFIKSENDTINVVSVDENENILFGLSEGFQRMRKLAVILAVLISNEKVKFIYPFIADAPLSSFGKGFVEAFFEVFSAQNFVIKQSIILVKDLFDIEADSQLTELGLKLFENNKFASLHINRVDADQTQTQRTTKISRYR
jgi:DNA sulfur modification protein DndD